MAPFGGGSSGTVLLPTVGWVAAVEHVEPGVARELERLVAAGTGAKTALSLFVIAEGIYEAQNFDNPTALPRSDSIEDVADIARDLDKQLKDTDAWPASLVQSRTLRGPMRKKLELRNRRDDEPLHAVIARRPCMSSLSTYPPSSPAKPRAMPSAIPSPSPSMPSASG